jgi:hypothetical protein
MRYVKLIFLLPYTTRLVYRAGEFSRESAYLAMAGAV